ncbi:MAG: carboxypeptidase regulatory-like domain-containing protein [Bacteroidetes bacterium]|nr:carboxypeptidase regulatory-like domain-containing protein [Bacteroidota bacterium]
MRIKLLLLLFFLPFVLFAQKEVNTLRGKVIDQDSKFPLADVSLVLSTSDSSVRYATTDTLGVFRFENVAVGKYNLQISLFGYKQNNLSNLLITSGKESIVEISMEQEFLSTEKIEIKKGAKLKNNMAQVSARSFDVEETNRYAGSRGDPARMASNYAGVQGSDDTRNDLVIRGNSPLGVVWRIDNVDVPAPNHFAIPGTNGGPVSMLNNKMLANSDFFTGAFPAEYSNGTAGVFDIRFKNGNNEKHEFTGQLGFLGTELAAEGPLSKKSKSSYLATYRYSTLQLFSAAGINIGTTALPKYSDASFKLNFPLKNKANFSIFGLGGSSSIDITVSDKGVNELQELYGRRDRDQHFASQIGVVGMSYTKTFNPKTFLSASLSTSYTDGGAMHLLVVRDSNYAVIDKYKKLFYNFSEFRSSAHIVLTNKIGKRATLKSGVNYSELFFSMVDQDYDALQNFTYRINVINHTGLARVYSQLKYALSEKLAFVGGLNFQYLLLNGSSALEPRASLKYTFNRFQSLAFGYGKHSQMQPSYLYFQQFKNGAGELGEWNKGIGFSKSDHYVLSYNLSLSKSLKVKAEAYYQWLYNIPVEEKISSFSMINFGMDARLQYPGVLVNTGIGRNYGMEFTLEKYFSKSFFMLFTASVFDSKYKGSDGIERNTAFNGNYVVNFLGGKEWKLSDNSTFVLSTKVTRSGGRRYTPLDLAASTLVNDAVVDSSQAYSKQFRDYFRLDLKVGYKLNRKHITHEFALDLVNVLNTKNVLRLSYVAPVGGLAAGVVEEQQLHFLPLFYYRIDF